MINIKKVSMKISGVSSCNFCSRGALIKRGLGLKYPYRTVYEIRGNYLLVTLCPECFNTIKNFTR